MDPLPPASTAPVPAPDMPEPSPTAPLERALREQGFLVRALLVVVTLLMVTTTLTLFHQIRWLVGQANQLNLTVQELTRVVGDYETNMAPQMNRFYQDLQRLAQANSDYARLFAKYQVTNAPAARTNPPPAPAPAGR